MMRSVGYQVTHYGVGGAESGANQQVDVLTHAQWFALGGREPGTRQHGDLARTDSRLYQRFNASLIPLLQERLDPQDLICLPFGTAHDTAMAAFPNVQQVEIGIGYPEPRARAPHRFRVYESHAWMHYLLGRASEQGNDYDAVIPNSYDPDDWSLGTGEGGYLLYFGRLNADKGLDIVVEIARHRPDLSVVLCGQGDPTPWLTLPNIRYQQPIHGAGRDRLLGDALAVLLPTRYVEPFGGVAVEAMLCGTPVLTSDFGAFTETVWHGYNGFRCRTLGDWLTGIAAVEGHAVQRSWIQAFAGQKFSMTLAARQYARVFRQIADLWGDGWFTSSPLEMVPCASL